MDFRRDGWISGILHNWYRWSVGWACVGQWISVDSMSMCLLFGHQCEQQRQGVFARYSATQNAIVWINLVSLGLWGPEGRVECKVKFDVADVAYPVVSLGKMIESGSTFSVDDYKCYMHKGNRRVEVLRKGWIFLLRMRRRSLESKVQMVAPIDEVAAWEMEIDDDGEGAGIARGGITCGWTWRWTFTTETRRSSTKFNKTRSRKSTSSNCPYQSLCVWHRKAEAIIIIVKRHSRWTETLRGSRWISCSVGAEGTFVDEPRRARAKVLMVICNGRWQSVRGRSAFENWWLRRWDAASILEYGRKCRDQDGWWTQHRRDCSKGTNSTRQNNDFGTNECWRSPRNLSSGTCECNSAGAVASVLPGRAGSYETENHSKYTIVSMDVAAFCLDGGALSIRSKNDTDSAWENKKLSIRFSVGTILRNGKNCRRWQDEKRQNWTVLGSNGLGKPCGQVKSTFVVDNEGLHQVQSGETHSKRQPSELQYWSTRIAVGQSAKMLRNATVRLGEPPRPSRRRPRKDGSPAQARTTTTSRHEGTRDDPMPGSSDDHRRQPMTETDVFEEHRDGFRNRESEWRKNRPRSTENGSRRRFFSRRTGTTKIEKQTNQPDDRWQMMKQCRSDWNERRRLLRSNKRFSELLQRGPIWNRHTNFTRASEHWGVPSRFMHQEW